MMKHEFVQAFEYILVARSANPIGQRERAGGLL